ncbi:acetolactate synthase 2 small subunit [Chitinivorax sp. B]|uniref:ACT domain-containing protein n=1 Tax=Chitinivorax sp. B TaxID=2502235 RepID=UPI0010F714DB|nr:acetolactate synthase 2 small subunit [Chitinivorax sp. B]
MRSRLNLTVLDRAGALERLLRVARHRGFVLYELTANRGTEGMLNIMVEVESDRQPMLLVSQWAKLPDVRALQIGQTLV